VAHPPPGGAGRCQLSCSGPYSPPPLRPIFLRGAAHSLIASRFFIPKSLIRTHSQPSRSWRTHLITRAEPEVRAAAAQLGGFVLIATHAGDPGQLTQDAFMRVLASPVTAVGWAKR